MPQPGNQAQQGNQSLPPKEQAVFKSVVKCYESKQYKKGIKHADAILKKVADHGETLAMKGLILSSLNKKEEAYDLARRALKADLRSHVCWHVYGLLYRSDRNYREAIKCYIQALRLDKDNVQILRDLCLLQIQMRDIPGFVETRHQLLQGQPTNRNNWIGFTIAHHLNKSYDLAVQILEAYEGTIEDIPASEAYEHSEMLLYKAMVLQEGGRYRDALKLLDDSKDKIKDPLGLREARAELLFLLKETDEAISQYRTLLSMNPDNYRLHQSLQQCLGLIAESGTPLSDKQRSELTSLYAELTKQHPQSRACARIPLDFLQGEEFLNHADIYVRWHLTRGVPSLFSDLKPLYADPAKAEALGSIFERFDKALQDSGALPAPPTSPASGVDPNNSVVKEGGEKQVQVWVLAYLAQHCSEQGDAEAALKHLDRAEELDPTLLELQSFRSKVLRRAGDNEGSSQAAEAARQLDLADRYINSLAVRSLFRAGHIAEAEETAALFTRDGVSGRSNLTDMQHMWYEVHCGRAHMVKKEWGRALKMFTAVVSHFQDIHEDQFDFHSYCVRKMTLRAYMHMLRMQDRLYNSEYFAKAVVAAVECYLAIHEERESSKASSQSNEAAATAGMTPEELKKWRLKKRKEEKRAAEAREREREAREKEAKEREAAAGKKKPSGGKSEDADPFGEKLAAVEDPLGEAAKLVAQIKEHASDRLSTHVVAFEVAIRKKLLLLALSSVQRALVIGGEGSPEAHRCAVLFCLAAQGKDGEGVNEVVQRVVKEGVEGLLKGKTVKQYNEAFEKRYGGTSVAHAAVMAEMKVAINAAEKAAAVSLVLSTKVPATKEGHQQAVAAHQLLLVKLGDAAAAEKFKVACSKVFLRSTYFEGELRKLPAAAATNNGGVSNSK